jgi:hypothetical protein
MQVIAVHIRSNNASDRITVGSMNCALSPVMSKGFLKQVKKLTAGELLHILYQ